ncbi:integrase [Aquipseudomonas ullengensis]|uniref:Integrase n=1 Tax=Aquipseudomonas ullengensis TaxID=2759166 RepID=A0A7W4QB02_9GAMM|nr:integrase [Pseudomonas ullengensis]
MKPAFIAKQLGHSIQILLTRYACWLYGASDWAEMEKSAFAPKSAPSVTEHL